MRRKWMRTAMTVAIGLTVAASSAPKALADLSEEDALYLSDYVYAAEAWAYRTGSELVIEPALDSANDSGDGPVEIASAASTAPAAPALSMLQYQVNPGDTLYKISKAFGITMDELLAANALDNPNRLQIGQTLDIPQGGEGWNAGGERPVVKRVLNSTLTAYTAGAESTGKTPSHPAYGITRSGSKAEEGRTVAVDPSIIPLGSTVLIEGIGVRKAEDTGSAIKGSRIDVYMNDLEEAVEFGVKKNVKVFVLTDRSA
ncbi:3D domain-containing protein [Paenibacillus flagellatus]|uniref:Murein transglycosylase n=1 Tax=Paenibacillus flagellatus TaxID=2211139 RepID=A0A2V5K5Q9_9BACL|nr:3D domain-containing protein [Paenibacillus flagellatus]PYI53053.1 murein transglycosylase [Paenibacillus flagellatus]